MKILVIADARIPIPPKQYGGTERIVHLLCEGLRQHGDTISLLAGPASRDYGGGVIVHRPPSSRFVSRAHRKILFQLLSLYAAWPVDIVVNFGRLDYLNALLRTTLPLICWFENPVGQSDIDYLLTRRHSKLRLVGVSESQLAGLKTENLSRVIHNCVDTGYFSFSESPAESSYFVFLGRMTRNKGVHLAIEVAKRANVPLKIAGNISHETGGAEHFEREVKPHLSPSCQWIGPVDDDQKRTLLQGAKALLFPIQWNEPFGIAAIESLACGTPVLGWRNGAMSEIIQPGTTGFICNSVDEMVNSVQRVLAGEIKRRACREDAETRFSQAVMISRTLEVVRELLSES
jgi:glycosyltransferase involved in cell wall biosynthesis